MPDVTFPYLKPRDSCVLFKIWDFRCYQERRENVKMSKCHNVKILIKKGRKKRTITCTLKKFHHKVPYLELRYCCEAFLFLETPIGLKLLISVTQDSRCWSAIVFRHRLARGIIFKSPSKLLNVEWMLSAPCSPSKPIPTPSLVINGISVLFREVKFRRDVSKLMLQRFLPAQGKEILDQNRKAWKFLGTDWRTLAENSATCGICRYGPAMACASCKKIGHLSTITVTGACVSEFYWPAE